jgi:zinc protease
MRLREKEGLSYGSGAWAFASSHDEAGGIGGYAIVAPQNLAKAKASILDEFAKMTTGKVEDAELTRAKDGWTKSQDTQLSDDDYVAGMLQGQLFDGRTTAWSEELRAKVAKVTTGDVERVAKKWLHPDRLIVVDAGDKSKASAPEAPKK